MPLLSSTIIPAGTGSTDGPASDYLSNDRHESDLWLSTGEYGLSALPGPGDHWCEIR